MAARVQGMPGRARVEDGFAWIDALPAPLGPEDVCVAQAAGRTLAHDVPANQDLPPFDRAAVDGLAVCAAETIGASTYNPCVLRLLDVSADLPAGAAVEISAGDALPSGADAIIGLEHVDIDGRRNGIITEPIAIGNGVERQGGQAPRGSTLVPAGRRLGAYEIGLLASAGAAQVAVVRKPRVRCLISQAMIEAGKPPTRGEVHDADGPLLRALIERDGGLLHERSTIGRARASLGEALQMANADIVLVAGGTGPGLDDHSAVALAAAGDLAFHGFAFRFAETAAMGKVAGVPVFLLPGAPLACLLAYECFAGRAIRRLAGRPGALPFPSRQMTTVRKIVSEIGMTELQPVRCLQAQCVEPIATLAEAGLKALAEADGFVLVPEMSEGYPKGASLTVYLYDAHEQREC